MNIQDSLDSASSLTNETQSNSTTIFPDQETLLLYLSNTYQFEGKSKLLSHGCDAKGPYVILSETIFYPQGGGNPVI